MEILRGTHIKKVAVNTASQLVVKFLTSGTTLVITLFISYFLGFSEFGSFTKIITFVSFFYLFVDFGINAIFLKNEKNSEKDFSNLLFLRVLLALILFTLLTSVSNFLPYNQLTSSGFSGKEKMGILIFGLTLFSQAIYLSLTALVQKEQIYKKIILPNIVSSVLLVAVVGIGIQLKNLNLVLFSYFFSSLVLAYLLFINLNKQTKIFFRINDFYNFSKTLLTSSFLLAFVLILNLMYSKADIFILSINKTSTDVGIYGLAYRFFEFLIAVPAFFSNSVYPILLDRKESSEFEVLVKKYLGILALTSLLLTSLTLIFSPLLPTIKSDFILSVIPLQILSLSLPFFFLTSLLQWVFIIKNKIKVLVLIYGTSMIINVFLNLIFIPLYSYTASSVITVVSEAFVFLLMIITLGLQRAKNT